MRTQIICNTMEDLVDSPELKRQDGIWQLSPQGVYRDVHFHTHVKAMVTMLPALAMSKE
jgi:hypothetical protein